MSLIIDVNDPNRARYGLVETFTTQETDSNKRLAPDGNNGLTWVNEVGLPYDTITSLDDLPDAVGGIITLSTDNINYLFSGIVDLGSNVLSITGSNIKLFGVNPATDGITSTSTLSVITANKGLNIQDLALIGFNAAYLIKCTGTGAEFLSSERMTYLGGVTQIDVTNFDTVAVNFGLHQLCTNGLMLHGTFKSYIHVACLFRDISGVGIDLDTSVSQAVGIDLCTCVNTATTSFISMLPNSGNLIPDGEGTITNCKVDISLGGVGSTGYSPLDLLWHVTGTNNIKTSDRVLPNGWEVAFDGEVNVPTQAISTTEVKLLIDGEAANSSRARLPNAIRDSGFLWDTVNNKITPIVIGDSYDLRVIIEISALSGNPTELTLGLDIGGGAAPSIVIAQDTRPIKGLTKPVIFSFPIFDETTFKTNGGQIFLNTETGTATISSRSIFIVRTSSGES
jgi:hypothetical protein